MGRLARPRQTFAEVSRDTNQSQDTSNRDVDHAFNVAAHSCGSFATPRCFHGVVSPELVP